MAVTADLLTKIQSYQKQGYTPDEIVQGIIKSPNFKDVARKANAYRKAGYSADDIIGGIQSSPMPQSEAEKLRSQFLADEAAPDTAETMRQKFIADTATTDTRIKEKLKDIGRAASPVVRPLMEGGGAAVGAILGGGTGFAAGTVAAPGPGTVAGTAAGGVAGSGLGYAMGKQAADLYDEALDLKAPETLPERAMTAAGDIATGATMEMGGQILGKGIAQIPVAVAAARNAGRRVADALPTMTERGIERRAGKVIAENMSDNPRFAANLAEAENLQIPGYQPSMAESTMDPGLIKLQRGIERAPGKASAIIAEQKAANQEALRDYLAQEFPGTENIDDVAAALTARQTLEQDTAQAARQTANQALESLPATNAQELGEQTVNAIDEAAAPVKAEMEKRFAELPNYPVNVANLRRMLNEQRGAKLPKDQRQKLDSILDYIDEQAQTGQIGLHDLRSIDQTINQYWVQSQNRMNPNFDELLTGFYGKLKGALRDDLDALGKQARTGSLHTIDGKVVDPAALSAELDNAMDLLSKAEATPGAVDVPAMQKRLVQQGGTQYMRQVRESDDSFLARTIQDYRRLFGEEPPAHPDARNEKYIADLKDRITGLRDKLNRIEPGKDVGTMYNRANRYAEGQYFNRFERGEVGDVQRFGNEANRLRVPFEEVGRKFTTPSGADDLIRAVGGDEASSLMFKHYSGELQNLADPVTGELSGKAGARWLARNRPTLQKYGLADRFDDLVKMQGAADDAAKELAAFNRTAAAKFLGADLDKAIDAAMQTSPKNTGAAMRNLLDTIGANPDARRGLENAFKDYLVSKAETTAATIAGDRIISPAEIYKQMTKYEPALRVLYGNAPGKITALDKVRRAIEIQGRSARSPIGGGSDTGEIQAMQRSILGHIAGPAGKWVTIGLGWLNKANAGQINELIAKALYDPALAQTLINAGKATATATEKRLNQHLIRLGIIGAKNLAGQGE